MSSCKSEMLLLQAACIHCLSWFKWLMNSLLMTGLFMRPLMLETAKDRMESQEAISPTSSIVTSIHGINSESYNLVREAIRILTGESMDGSAHVLIPWLTLLRDMGTLGVGWKTTALTPSDPEPSFPKSNKTPKHLQGFPNWLVDLEG